MKVLTLQAVAAEFRCEPNTITSVAREHGIGACFGSRVGWRFTEEDKAALSEAMRPSRPNRRIAPRRQ